MAEVSLGFATAALDKFVLVLSASAGVLLHICICGGFEVLTSSLTSGLRPPTQNWHKVPKVGTDLEAT